MTDLKIQSQNKKIYSAYDVHIDCSILTPEGDDKTKQSFGDECDINCIMAKYTKTGIIESGNSTQPKYGDASAFDFQEAQNTIIVAEQMFNALPARIRATFDNNPHTMLAWMDDPQNAAEATSLGLLQAAVDLEPALPSPILSDAPKASVAPSTPVSG